MDYVIHGHNKAPSKFCGQRINMGGVQGGAYNQGTFPIYGHVFTFAIESAL